MLLYHYRSIDSALPEISDSTFRFASCEELNDPLETYLHVFWQGDKSAWEGMFRNYVCSLYYAIECYLLEADGNKLRNSTLMIDIERFGDVPMGKILKELGEEFLSDDNIHKLSSVYGDEQLKVQREELQMLFQFIHRKALELCIKKNRDNGIMPKDEAAKLLEYFIDGGDEKSQNAFEEMLDILQSQEIDDEKRYILSKVFEEVFEEETELAYINKGLEDETFLHPHNKEPEDVEKKQMIEENKDGVSSESILHRNWMTLFVDFPKVYVNQLIHMLYPECFIVCFSANGNNSAMWGNYADHHKGVCLIYETDEKQSIHVQNRFVKAEKVVYKGEMIERNFFESFGRLTFPQIKKWLTGTDGISCCYDVFRDENEWREQYWKAYQMKNYRKLDSWASEEEYRLVIDNTFYDYSEPDKRILPYDSEALKGVIFGIETSEYDKLRIMKSLMKRNKVNKHFSFWQAEYDYKNQKIEVREKKVWNMKAMLGE